MTKLFQIIAITFLTFSSIAQDKTRLKIVVGTSTFDAVEVLQNRVIPWDLVYGNDSSLWFTEKTGGIYRLDRDYNLHEVGIVEESRVSKYENAGMHAMCFHPQWPDSSFLYVHYPYEPDYSTLVRLEIDQKSKRITGNKRVIFDSIPAARSHNGSRLTIGPDQNILFAMGDAYQFDPAQDLESLSGKVLRFTPWGSVPADNPIPGNYTWSYGHRNPQGLVYAENGILYSSEHGPATDDEINIIQKGKNYGWPKVNGFCDLDTEKKFCEEHDVVEPIWAFTPTCAPSGLTYYGSDYFPELKNHLLQCFLKVKALCVLKLSDDGTKALNAINFFENDYYRLRDVEVAQDGSLYISTSNCETTSPPIKPLDDKIIHITNLNKSNGKPVFQDISVDGNKLNVNVIGTDMEGSVQMTMFYGGVLKETMVPINSMTEFTYVFDEPNVYWLKFVQEGRIVTKMIHVKPID